MKKALFLLIFFPCFCNADDNNHDLYQRGMTAIEKLINARDSLQKKLESFEEYFRSIDTIPLPPPPTTSTPAIDHTPIIEKPSQLKKTLVILTLISCFATIGILLYLLSKKQPPIVLQFQPEPSIPPPPTLQINLPSQPDPIQEILGSRDKKILVTYAAAVRNLLTEEEIITLNKRRTRFCDKKRLIAEKLRSLQHERYLMLRNHFYTTEKSLTKASSPNKDQQKLCNELNADGYVANYFKDEFLGKKIEQDRIHNTRKSSLVLRDPLG